MLTGILEYGSLARHGFQVFELPISGVRATDVHHPLLKPLKGEELAHQCYRTDNYSETWQAVHGTHLVLLISTPYSVGSK